MDFCRKQVKSDCEELLSRFQTTESVRFQLFSDIWREMKFEQIFYGTMKHEKRMFSRLVLDTAYRYFLPPFSFQIRVGGLYLLYSLFHCQTASPSEQIRLSLKDWEDVKKFEKDAVNAQHFDVTFILRQMMFHKAFHFTAMPTLLVFKKKRKIEGSPLCEEFMERTSRPQELINTELLEELSNIHDLYEKMKVSVASSSEQAPSSVNLIRKDLVPQLRGTVVDFYKWQQRKDETDDDEDSGEGTSSQQECSRRAELVASIKSKAYGNAAEASKSRRHRQVEVDFTSSEAGPALTLSHSRTSRPSLKARTNESVFITGDLWKEAMTSTQINCLTTLDSVPEEKPKQYKRFKW
ncbi:snRNA-activating protein complex subunit 1b [Thunnus albacares]|uniref:snRNA-activating protein complex subunit 1b n=1 Tax=Thunnus albacares TaxID=8236 RepID=UPI001CF707D9|nr:snRNA-activating protein complex subunit 1b [Thunnus albacares]